MHWLLGVVAPIAVTIYTAVSIWKQRHAVTGAPETLLIGILAVGLFGSAVIVHMSDQNLWLSNPLTLTVVAVWLRKSLASMPARRLQAAAATAPLIAIYIAGLSPMILGYALVCHNDGTGFLREVSAPEGTLCVTFDSAPTVTEAIRFSSDHRDSAVAFLPIAPSLYQITGRVPPVPNIFLVPGVIAPDQLARVEHTLVGLPVEWVIYYKIDFGKDLPSDRALQDGTPFHFDVFLDTAYNRQDHDHLVIFRLKR
jgi:hypothetical protein